MTDTAFDKTGWVVLKQPRCRYCTIAIDLLDKAGAEVTILDVSTNEGLKTFLKASGLTTVPQVFQHGHLIGGSDDLTTYLLSLGVIDP